MKQALVLLLMFIGGVFAGASVVGISVFPLAVDGARFRWMADELHAIDDRGLSKEQVREGFRVAVDQERRERELARAREQQQYQPLNP